MIPCRTAASADLGDSSKYSNENFEAARQGQPGLRLETSTWGKKAAEPIYLYRLCRIFTDPL